MIICDIDGCLFDNRQRANLIPKDKRYMQNWHDFHKACLSDLAIVPVINFVKHMASKQNNKIVFVTSRGVCARQETIEQLFTYFSHFICQIKMREMDDHRDTVDYKRATFQQLSEELSN